MFADLRLLIVGNLGGTNVGDSFFHAAKEWGLDVRVMETRQAFAGNPLRRAFTWWLLGRRPPALRRFNRLLGAALEEFRPTVLLATGLAPVVADTLAGAGAAGVRTLNYLTDDPWNPAHRSRWFLRALPHYDVVFSPRRANLEDLRNAGCPRVEYLPFAYDARFAHPPAVWPAEDCPDIVFAGGADRDRVPILGRLIAAGFRVALYGDHWERYAETRCAARGHADPQTLCRATAAAKVALCLVRRANRDGHVMRTFEIAATRGCMLAEDTAEHRRLLGEEGEGVLYFACAEEMVAKARWLLDHPQDRRRLAAALYQRITAGRNTYRDRLETMLLLGAGAKKAGALL